MPHLPEGSRFMATLAADLATPARSARLALGAPTWPGRSTELRVPPAMRRENQARDCFPLPAPMTPASTSANSTPSVRGDDIGCRALRKKNSAAFCRVTSRG